MSSEGVYTTQLSSEGSRQVNASCATDHRLQADVPLLNPANFLVAITYSIVYWENREELLLSFNANLEGDVFEQIANLHS